MGFKDFFKISSEQWGLPAEHLEGLDKIPYKAHIGILTQRDGKYVEFEFQENKIILPFKQIVQVNFVTWEKTIEKALDPFAEGIVGGLIGGHTMAVVSAIDAKNRTRSEKVTVEKTVEIQYHPKGSLVSIRNLFFKSGMTQGTTLQWVKTLCRCAGLPEPRYIIPEPQGTTYL